MLKEMLVAGGILLTLWFDKNPWILCFFMLALKQIQDYQVRRSTDESLRLNAMPRKVRMTLVVGFFMVLIVMSRKGFLLTKTL